MSKQTTIQKYVMTWDKKTALDKRIDYEYLIGYREMMWDFIRSKGLYDEFMDYFRTGGDRES